MIAASVRDELRAKAQAWLVEITTPGNAGTDAWHALEDALLGDGPELLIGLLDHLAEAERVLRVISGWNPDKVDVATAIQPALDYFKPKEVAGDGD